MLSKLSTFGQVKFRVGDWQQEPEGRADDRTGIYVSGSGNRKGVTRRTWNILEAYCAMCWALYSQWHIAHCLCVVGESMWPILAAVSTYSSGCPVVDEWTAGRGVTAV